VRSAAARCLAPIWAVAVCLLLLTSCERSQGGSTTLSPMQTKPGEEQIAAVPMGDEAGAASSDLASMIVNPYRGDAQAVQQGHDLFIKMNCAGCHGYDAAGGMGPNLTDKYWRYGGAPVNIYKSIYEGRPKGMPAWNLALPSSEIWKLVSYIQSLGGTYAAKDYQRWLQGDQTPEIVPPEVRSEQPVVTELPVAPPGGADMPVPAALKDAAGG